MPQNPPEGANFALGRRFRSDNPQKDNFHKAIFDIDKTLAFGTVGPA